MKPRANGSPEKGIQHAELEYNIKGGTSSYSTPAFSTHLTHNTDFKYP